MNRIILSSPLTHSDWMLQKDGPEGGPTERYIPQWTGGMPADGGGLEKHILRAIDALSVGQKAKVGWLYEMRRRATSVEPLGAGAGPAGPKIAPGVAFRHGFETGTDGFLIDDVVGEFRTAAGR